MVIQPFQNRFTVYFLLVSGVLFNAVVLSQAQEIPGMKGAISSGNLTVTLTADPPGVCQGAPSQLNADASGGTPPYTYLWFPSTGLSDTIISNPVATPMISTWFHVRVIDNVPDTVQDSILVTVETAPPAPGPINGPASACVYTSAGYTINPVIGATSYSWTVPGGATITEGQNTPSIVVLWDTTGGTVSVIAGNTCGLSNPCVLPVSLFRPPGVPATIYGPNQLCENATGEFSVDQVPDVQSYFWSVPAGTFITGGQGTNMISVLWGAESGDVSVVTQNPCGNSDPKDKAVATDSVPGLPDPISGKDTVCEDHNGYEYSIPAIPNTLSYKWVLPAGAVISGVADTNFIVVDFNSGAASGNITVYGMNSCGVGPGKTKYITVNDCTGIDSNSSDPPVSVSAGPEPRTLNLVFVKIIGRTKLKVVGITGAEIFTKELDITYAGYSITINLSTCSAGIYLLEIITGNGPYTQKFILR